MDNLVCLFVLIDSRIEPQDSDLRFIEFLGKNNIPFARVFTKSDKISANAASKSVKTADNTMLKTWESLPVTFIASAKTEKGKEELLSFIEESINNFSNDNIK